MCAAYLDKYLGQIIEFRLPGLNSELKSKIFSPDGILGTFASRIDIGTALKSIDGELSHDLKLIASLRNKFAHELTISTFDHPEILKQLDKMRYRPRIIDGDKQKDKEILERYEKLNRRQRFEVIGTFMCMSLHNTLHTVATVLKKHGAKD